MKKILAILLILAMTLPMCFVANAEGEDVGIRPFYLVNTDRNVEEDEDNIFPKIFFWSQSSDKYVTEDSIRVSAVDVGGSTPKEIAEKLKPIFDKYPDGTRYLRFGSLGSALKVLLEDWVYMEKGAAVMNQWFTEFIEHYRFINGKIDGLIVDLEYFELSTYYTNQEAQKDMYIYKKIVENPNYETKLRPALVERGFKFWDKISDETPEIYSISDSAGAEYAQSRAVWNVVLRNHVNKYIDDAVLKPLLDNYPNAVLSDYQSRNTYAWNKDMSDKGGVSTGGNYHTAGNASYFNTYAARPGTGFFTEDGGPVYKNIPSYNGTIWADNAYNMVMWDTIHYKSYYEAAPDNKTTAIVVYYQYNNRPGGYCNTPYYSEMFYHVCMLDPQPLQGYCMEDEMKATQTDIDMAMQIISELLDEMTRICGAADRKPIVYKNSWNDKFILSGMYAGGKNYWRITPDTLGTNTTLESFKVAGTTDPTFSIQGQTITFPGGKIIEGAKISEVGTCGYWVETSKDVMPTVSYAGNRYEQYPAYAQDFQTMTPGEFDFNTAEPLACWEVKKSKDSSAKIVANGDDKVLAMSGTYSLKLKDILENVTAGDTYAKNQAWEIDVTVPANMAADAEIVLLDIYGSKAKPEAGGFKIAGGKLYYDRAGEYVELTGVDVSKGGKFKLKRCLDFTNAEGFTSDYAVYDASGKLLSEVKDVAIATIKLPVQKVAVSVSKITGDAVQLDNLKLYVNGLAADFELYDFETGIEYTDLETAKTKSTAYRLSWLNGTAYEKVYSIVAEYADGTTKVLKEIKMAPGVDGVTTGIVELAEGQSVKIYARNDSKADPENPNQGDAGKDKAKNDDMMLVIVLIVAGVILVAIFVVGVIVLKKKPAVEEEKKETPETEENTEE